MSVEAVRIHQREVAVLCEIFTLWFFTVWSAICNSSNLPDPVVSQSNPISWNIHANLSRVIRLNFVGFHRILVVRKDMNSNHCLGPNPDLNNILYKTNHVNCYKVVSMSSNCCTVEVQHFWTDTFIQTLLSFSSKLPCIYDLSFWII